MGEAKTLITAEQFAEMYFPDGRAELVDGQVVTFGPFGFEHGAVCVNLLSKLYAFVKVWGLGAVVNPFGFLIRRNPDLVRAPDVAFISQEKLVGQYRTRKFWEGPPDLAVEVLSPEDRAGEVLRKVGEYLDAGTRLVWVVDSENQRVSAYRGLNQVRVYSVGEELSGEDVLPGFSLPVNEIFA